MRKTAGFFALVSMLALGCTDGREVRGRRDGGPGGGLDSGTPPSPDGSIGPVNPCASSCGPDELCGEGDGNGLDDDCDGSVDETCTCPAPGVARPCFAGPPDRRNVGACSDGVEICNEFLTWSACTGGTSPVPETCNGSDSDCNGVTDDVAGCSAPVVCPGNDISPPLSNYTLRGGRVTTTGTATGYRWSVDCPASVPAELCPVPASPNSMDSDVYFTASGAYRVHVTVTLADGTEASCGWTVYVQGTGLRVELNWDTMLDTAGGTDVDLHLHRWTRNGVDSDFYNDDDCYWANCQPDDDINWSDHVNSPLENCEDAPHGGGADWRARGSCRNPRLDVDTNGTDGACSASVTDPSSDAFCAPENINVDDPIVGMPYRVMVNYYNDSGHSGITYPTVNVYCGGALRGSFGRDPLVQLREGSSAGQANDNWYVADVVFFEGTCGLDCMIYPLSITPVQGTPDPGDPFGITSVVPFGPTWSCNYDAASGTCTE